MSVDMERKRDRGQESQRQRTENERHNPKREEEARQYIVGTERKHTKRGEAEGCWWHVGS